MSSTKEKKNFLDLPPEIRNRIYHFMALPTQFSARYSALKLALDAADIDGPKYPTFRAIDFEALPGMLFVSKQIYEEFRGILKEHVWATLMSAIVGRRAEIVRESRHVHVSIRSFSNLGSGLTVCRRTIADVT